MQVHLGVELFAPVCLRMLNLGVERVCTLVSIDLVGGVAENVHLGVANRDAKAQTEPRQVAGGVKVVVLRCCKKLNFGVAGPGWWCRKKTRRQGAKDRLPVAPRCRSTVLVVSQAECTSVSIDRVGGVAGNFTLVSIDRVGGGARA